MKYTTYGGWTIPILDPGEACTDDHVSLLQGAIQSDGCTLVSELYHPCCVMHDLGYEFGIDPWGKPIDKSTIDTNFRRCMESRSQLGRFSPIAWSRWLGVAVLGKWFRRRKA